MIWAFCWAISVASHLASSRWPDCILALARGQACVLWFLFFKLKHVKYELHRHPSSLWVTPVKPLGSETIALQANVFSRRILANRCWFIFQGPRAIKYVRLTGANMGRFSRWNHWTLAVLRCRMMARFKPRCWRGDRFYCNLFCRWKALPYKVYKCIYNIWACTFIVCSSFQ